jgi:hypothetical protein
MRNAGPAFAIVLCGILDFTLIGTARAGSRRRLEMS